MNQEINFVGGGNMATAIISSPGLAQALASKKINVADPVAQIREHLDKLGCNTFATPSQLPSADTTFLCTKPQDLATACKELCERKTSANNSSESYISIAAGINLDRLKDWLSSSNVVRTMPNTPLLVGSGCTFAYTDLDQKDATARLTQDIFSNCGIFYWVETEDKLDAVTALSGSGPAYAYLLIEAMTEAAVSLGLEEDQALQAAIATVGGASKMLTETKEPPAILRERVSSKGGTTLAALEVFANQNFRQIVKEAMQAANNRARELAK